MSVPKPRILIVEDEAVIAMSIENSLLTAGYDVSGIVATGEDAIQHCAAQAPDLVLMDVRLKGSMDGIEAAQHIKQMYDLPVIYLTAYTDAETVGRAERSEPFGYLSKPLNEHNLLSLRIALLKHRMEMELKAQSVWFLAAISSIGDAVIGMNASNQIWLLNTAAEKLTEWKEEELIGKHAAETIQIHDAEYQPVPVFGLAGQEFEGRGFLTSKSGSEVPVAYHLTPINANGAVLGSIMVLRGLLTGATIGGDTAAYAAGRTV
jgi:PAS domain S-box-containing protein